MVSCTLRKLQGPAKDDLKVGQAWRWVQGWWRRKIARLVLGLEMVINLEMFKMNLEMLSLRECM